MKPTNRAVWRRKWEGRRDPVNTFAKGLLRRLGKGKGRTLLDVGCGNGVDSLYFAARGYRVVSTDFSESGIAALDALAAKKQLKIRSLLHDTAKKFPFRDGSFDIVYAHLALHYFDDATTRKVFAEMRRLLRKGGLFFVKCKSTKDCLYGAGEEIGPDIFREGHVRHFFTPAYMKEMLRDFNILSLRTSSSSYHGKTSAFVSAVAKA